ncbi:hypothetical protein THIOSC15_2930024 [uncultured Thiomicrorhabdus sp.]
MAMFGAQEVAIITRFGDNLYEWVDVDVVESFVVMGRAEQMAALDAFVINGDNILTFLYLKTIVFRLDNGHAERVYSDMSNLGIDWPAGSNKVVPLFN